MIEGRALVPMATGRPIAHICAHCVEVGEGLFAQHERKNARLEKPADTPRARGPPRRLHHRPGAREEDPGRRRRQPLQAGPRRPRSTTRRSRTSRSPRATSS